MRATNVTAPGLFPARELNSIGCATKTFICAGMKCVDCHRNGIDHHIVRGFDDEEKSVGQLVATLSCAGCHLGDEPHGADQSAPIAVRAGRLGSPKPAHKGLPAIHFEKISCTGCHSGPVPREQALRLMTSLAHGLGEKGRRTGEELPAMLGPLYTTLDDTTLDDDRIYPQRGLWPAYWGVTVGDQVRPLAPDKVFDVTRKALRVRRNFVSEVLQPTLNSSELKLLLGEDQANVDADEWTDQQRSKVAGASMNLGSRRSTKRFRPRCRQSKRNLASIKPFMFRQAKSMRVAKQETG